MEKDPAEPGSYQPVALMEVIMWVLKKLIQKVIMDHAEKYNLLRDSTHGFRRERSTLSNILWAQQNIFKAG